MLKRKFLIAVVLTLGLLMGRMAAADQECGEVTIASMTWASAELIAEIDKFILTEGYGCKAELVAGDTVTTFTSMQQNGSPDLAPELWVNAVRESLDVAVAEGGLRIAAEVLSDGGEQGWWIPKYLADAHPEIKTPADALARPDLFPAPEDELSGAVHNCPSGWSCQISTSNLFNAYGGEETGFELIDTGSSAGLDGSIAKAHVRGAGWLGYYWSPTAILGRYEMVKLDMGPHNPEHWKACTSVQNCESPQINAWSKNEVFTVITDEFEMKASVAMDYITTRSWENSVVNKLLAWMADNQASSEEAARQFLENYENVWGAWVSADVMARVKAVL